MLIVLPRTMTSSPERVIGGPSILIAPSRDLIRAIVTLIMAPTRLTSSVRQLIDTQGR
jgi:hypothetical protein